jgi:hypothetical protein
MSPKALPPRFLQKRPGQTPLGKRQEYRPKALGQVFGQTEHLPLRPAQERRRRKIGDYYWPVDHGHSEGAVASWRGAAPLRSASGATPFTEDIEVCAAPARAAKVFSSPPRTPTRGCQPSVFRAAAQSNRPRITAERTR